MRLVIPSKLSEGVDVVEKIVEKMVEVPQVRIVEQVVDDDN